MTFRIGYLLYVVTHMFERKIWIGVRPIQFMNVIDSDRPLIIDRSDQNVYGQGRNQDLQSGRIQ